MEISAISVDAQQHKSVCISVTSRARAKKFRCRITYRHVFQQARKPSNATDPIRMHV